MNRAAAFCLIFILGMLVFFLGGYWAGMSYWVRTAVKIALPVVLLVFTLTCRRYEHLRGWYKLALGFLAASCGFLASWLVSGPLLRVFGLSTDSIPGITAAKLFDALPIVIIAFLVARLGGMKPGDLFLRKGKVAVWLTVGLIAFAGFTVVFLLQASGKGIAFGKLASYAPWTLIFVFSNAFMEEFHFRGLLLGPAEGILGRNLANVCIALFFALVHAPVQYTPDIAFFLALVFVLALAWGYIVQKTGALWGAVLFHAGADLLIIIGIFETYGSQ